MIVKINGKDKNINFDKLNISELLKISEVEKPEMVSVQLNKAFIEKDKYDSTPVSENDEVDFLYFMGGGAL
ncbi:MAG: sulfur carrier protein ThiS [bacterium]